MTNRLSRELPLERAIADLRTKYATPAGRFLAPMIEQLRAAAAIRKRPREVKNRWRGLLLTAAAAFTLLAGSDPGANAQQVLRGSAAAGRQLALHNCDSCHVVAADQDLPPIPNYAPRFFEIAARPGISAESLQDFLSQEHPMSKMPYSRLTPKQLADVTAYILSLRGRQR